jgi:menaquinone-dependent protoporphyrinogen IX oxidase
MDLRLLVAAASKHGSYAGDSRSDRRRGRPAVERQGLCVELHSLELAEVGSTAAYDAVVVGSAVYAGRWLPKQCPG